MRPGQQNRRGRNRNRNRGGGGGGNGANRVHDSNGPDVKLRGTAQTIAEKYMQLGRDAQAAGDPVMAESYYQHADHYYRLWLAMQPAGQPVQFSRRVGEEELDDEGADGPVDGEEESAVDGALESGAFVEAQTEDPEQRSESDEADGTPGFQNRPRRDFQPREGGRDPHRDHGREGANRFRNRWGRRNDRYGQDSQGGEGQGEGGDRQDGRRDRPPRHDRQDRLEREARNEAGNGNGRDAVEEEGNWEAPSFLKRPMPAATDEGQEP